MGAAAAAAEQGSLPGVKDMALWDSYASASSCGLFQNPRLET